MQDKFQRKECDHYLSRWGAINTENYSQRKNEPVWNLIGWCPKRKHGQMNKTPALS